MEYLSIEFLVILIIVVPFVIVAWGSYIGKTWRAITDMAKEDYT